MKYDYALRLYQDGRKFFGPGVATLLELVSELGSLRAAATQMGMAYSKAWQIVRNAESVLGYPLLESRAGGRGGGGAVVSARAQEFLARYRTFERNLRESADSLYTEVFGFSSRREPPS